MQPSQQTDRRVCHSEPRRVCRRGAGMGRSASAPASATGGALEARRTRPPSDDRYELWAFSPLHQGKIMTKLGLMLQQWCRVD